MTRSAQPVEAARRTALVSGASSGIGKDLAEILAENGHDLVLVARTRDVLEELAGDWRARHGAAVQVLAADLADPSSPQRIYDELRAKAIAVDILVNNAGFGAYGRFADTDPSVQLQMLQVNVVSLTHLTRLLLPAMIQRHWGRILNVASTAAFVPGPLMSVYYASKAYVLSESLALARELRRTGVTLTVLCPGPTATAFQERAHMQQANLFRLNVMRSRDVALAGYRGLVRGKALVVPGMLNKLTALGSRMAPHSLLARIAMQLNRQRR